ncbi:MAG: DUF6064 family protein [Pseudomonadota bacterium]
MTSIAEFLAFVGSYSLIDFVSFDSDGYLRLFKRANNAVWPLPVFSLVCSVALLYFAWQTRWLVGAVLRRVLCLGFAASWISVAYVFHWSLLGELNVAGKIFALLFAIQSCLLLIACKRSSQQRKLQAPEILWGKVLLITGLIIYPLLPWINNHSEESIQWFAIAPDPSCLITLGIFFTKGLWRWWISLIPLTWCVTSGLFTTAMGLTSGWLMLGSAAVSFALMIYCRNVRPRSVKPRSVKNSL